MERKDLYIKKLEEQNAKLRKELKWKLEAEEHSVILKMILSNFIQLTQGKDHDRIERQIMDYPYGPHPISKNNKTRLK